MNIKTVVGRGPSIETATERADQAARDWLDGQYVDGFRRVAATAQTFNEATGMNRWVHIITITVQAE
jgi:hypothetical protein